MLRFEGRSFHFATDNNLLKHMFFVGLCRTGKVWWNDEIIGITPSCLILFILINRPIIHLKIASFQPIFQPYKGRLNNFSLPL